MKICTALASLFLISICSYNSYSMEFPQDITSEGEFDQINLTEETSLNIQTMRDVTADSIDRINTPTTCAFQLGRCQTCWGLGVFEYEEHPTVSVPSIVSFSVSTAAMIVIGMATSCSLPTACPFVGTLPFLYQCFGLTPYDIALFYEHDDFKNDFIKGYNHEYPGAPCKERFCKCF